MDSFAINPGWNGNALAGSDLAIITLSAAASAGIQRYEINRSAGDLGSIFDFSGYGLIGTGATGSTGTGQFPTIGTRHHAENTFEDTIAGGEVLLSDFDSGNLANDAFHFFDSSFPINLGLGALEGSTAPGDSGGPAFIGGKIAGVTSFGARFNNLPNGTNSDLDAVLNSSFGELNGFTRVVSFQTWIDAIVVPEPSTFALCFGALALVTRRLRKFR